MATAPSVDPDFGPTATANRADGKKAGNRLQCVVVTPERILFDEVVDAVVLPLIDGSLGVLPGRSPLIGRLGYGELKTTSGGSDRRYFVDGGFAEVRDNVVNILTGRAIPAASVDATAAQGELEKAKARKASTEQEVVDRTRAIERAQAQIRIAGHRD